MNPQGDKPIDMAEVQLMEIEASFGLKERCAHCGENKGYYHCDLQ